MIYSSKISNWLKSGEYLSLIDSVLTKIIRDCESSDSEAHTSSIFENEIYYLVRSQLGIELQFSKEAPIEGIVHKFEGLSSRKSGHGRLDAVVNNIITFSDLDRITCRIIRKRFSPGINRFEK